MISKVIKTSSSSNLLRYIEDKHAHNDELTDQRNLFIASKNLGTINGKHDAGYDSAQFNAVQQRAKNKHKKTKAYHLIFSFSDDEFPVTNDKKILQEQAIQASALIYKFLQENLDDDVQFLLASQRDGQGKKMHVHVALNAVKMSGKVLDTNQIRLLDKGKDKGLRSKLDKYLQDNFEEVTGRHPKFITPQTTNLVSASEVHIQDRENAKKKNAYGWKEHLKAAIYQAFSASSSIEEFKQKLEQNNVTITERRARIDNDSSKKQYRKAFTYTFIDDNKKKHKIRDFAYYRKRGTVRGLGKSFTPDSLEKEFEIKNDSIKKQRIQQDQSTAKSIKQLANAIITRTSTSDSRISESRSEQADAITEFRRNSKKLDNSYKSTKSVDRIALARNYRQEDEQKTHIQLFKTDLQSFKYIDNDYYEALKCASERRKERERKLERRKQFNANIVNDTTTRTAVDFRRNSESRREQIERVNERRRLEQLDENPFDD